MIAAITAGAAEDSDSDVMIARHGGADRYATSLPAAKAFAAEVGGSPESVVLVSGEAWPRCAQPGAAQKWVPSERASCP